MGQLIITTNMSLDGVVEDPDGHEGSDRGGWFARSGGADLEQWTSLMTKEAHGAAALLLGRRSDEWFATRWATRTGEWADRLNGLPKYVVSTTAERAEWGDATVLPDAGQVAAVKQEVTGEILLYASYQLGRELLERDLVDELRLFVLPIVAGAGDRLFGTAGSRKPWSLTGARPVGAGLTYLTYRAGRSL